MKAVEFDSTMTASGHIVLAPEVTGTIPAGEQLRVVVMWEPTGLDQAWRLTGRQRFEESYAAEDDIYEQLINDAPDR